MLDKDLEGVVTKLETHPIECPWCSTKLELDQPFCPTCNNEAMKFEEDKNLNSTPEPAPLGLWNFVYISLCVIAIAQILQGYYLFTKLDVSYYTEVWSGYPYYLVYAIIQSTIHLLCLLISIICILKRFKFVPTLIITFEIVYLIFMFVSFYLEKVTPLQNVNYIWLAIGLSSKIIWMLYYGLSKTVRQIFVR